MEQRIKSLAAVPAALILVAMMASCGKVTPSAIPSPVTSSPAPEITQTAAPTPEPTPTPRPILTVRGLFPGEEPRELPNVFNALNKRLGEDIAASLELSWAPMEGYDDAAATEISSGNVDFLWCDSSKLHDYAAKNLLAPLDSYIEGAGKPILDTIDARLIDTMRIGGSLMGIPSAGNMPQCDTGNVLVYREDLRQKYGLPELNSIDAVEQYFKSVKEKEPSLTPVSADNAAFAILKSFGPEGVLPGTGNAVSYRINSDGTITCMGLQDAPSFKGAAERVRSWYKAGWLPKDVMAAKDASAALTTGTAAAACGQALSAVSLQADAGKNCPGAALSEAPLFGASKYLESDGGSALCLAAGGRNAETTVGVWSWVLSSQENYNLFCYGIENVHYEISAERISILNDGYTAFPSWIFANVNYLRFPVGVPDGCVDAYRNWNEGAALSPLAGFAFDATAVKNELVKVKAVYGVYGPALNTGSVDTAALLAEFGVRMKAAGQANIVAEAQAQINAFLSGK